MHKIQEARNGHGFGRLKRLPDTRDFHASALLPKLMNLSGKPPRIDHEWTVGAPLDQGQLPECFPPGTLVQLASGAYRPIEEIRCLDEVVTAEGNIGAVLTVMVRRTREALLKLILRGHRHLKLTTEHPVLTKRGYVKASALIADDWVCLTRFTPRTVSELPVSNWLEEKEIAREPRAVVRSGVLGRGGTTTNVAPMRRSLRLTPGLGRLFGLFLAEGHTKKCEITWSFGAHEHDLVEGTLELLSSELGIEGRVAPRRNNCIQVHAGGVAWSKLFAKLFQTGCANKGLPPELASGPEDFRRELLKGWLDGDGYERRTSKQGVTVSHRLLMDMFAISQALGLRPTVRRSDPKISHGVRKRRPRWDLVFGGNERSPHAQQDERAVWRRVVAVEPVEYHGPVYNLEVEGDNSYVAEGIGVHNCVAYTGAKLLYAGPVLNRRNVPDPETIYAACQANDEWAGTPHDGSSSRGLMKALQIMGYIGAYAFTLEIPTLCDWLANISPVAMGTVWTWQMETPVAYQRKSWLMIDPGPIAEADVAGGHEWLLYGVHRNKKCPDGTKGAAKMINSWGLPFGDAGTAFVPLSLLQTLLLADGDCVMPTEIRKPAKAAA